MSTFYVSPDGSDSNAGTLSAPTAPGSGGHAGNNTSTLTGTPGAAGIVHIWIETT